MKNRVITLDNNEMLKAMKEMMREELEPLKNDMALIKKDLYSIKTQVIENTEILKSVDDKLNNLEGNNADNHVTIKGDIKDLKETVEEIEVDLKMVKKIIIINSKDIEKMTIAK